MCGLEKESGSHEEHRGHTGYPRSARPSQSDPHFTWLADMGTRAGFWVNPLQPVVLGTWDSVTALMVYAGVPAKSAGALPHL